MGVHGLEPQFTGKPECQDFIQRAVPGLNYFQLPRVIRESGVLATSKSGTLLLKRDQGEMAVLLDSRSRRL